MSTKISWAANPDGTAGETLNWVFGCDKVSPGCAHCYAEIMAKRLKAMGHKNYQLATKGGKWSREITTDLDVLNKIDKWRKPRTVFMNSMSDTFHKDVPTNDILIALEKVRLFPQHTFIFVTKRAKRMMDVVNVYCDMKNGGKPLLNAWFLVSTENQKTFDERIGYLMRTNAAVRGISAEPLLGAIEPGLDGTVPKEAGDICTHVSDMLGWVIVGGESGHKARPMHPDWAKSLRNQCVSAGVPFFFKQWGAWSPKYKSGADFVAYSRLKNMYRVGSSESGDMLDGREWKERPAMFGDEKDE